MASGTTSGMSDMASGMTVLVKVPLTWTEKWTSGMLYIWNVRGTEEISDIRNNIWTNIRNNML